jgi:hypothetical protein
MQWRDNIGEFHNRHDAASRRSTAVTLMVLAKTGTPGRQRCAEAERPAFGTSIDRPGIADDPADRTRMLLLVASRRYYVALRREGLRARTFDACDGSYGCIPADMAPSRAVQRRGDGACAVVNTTVPIKK